MKLRTTLILPNAPRALRAPAPRPAPARDRAQPASIASPRTSLGKLGATIPPQRLTSRPGSPASRRRCQPKTSRAEGHAAVARSSQAIASNRWRRRGRSVATLRPSPAIASDRLRRLRAVGAAIGRHVLLVRSAASKAALRPRGHAGNGPGPGARVKLRGAPLGAKRPPRGGASLRRAPGPGSAAEGDRRSGCPARRRRARCARRALRNADAIVPLMTVGPPSSRLVLRRHDRWVASLRSR